ncbi:hypothetical protein Tco_0075285 [Tanacetum coccineum]
MAISVNSISLDFLDESAGSSPSRIILFGTILAKIPTKTPTIPPVVPTIPHTSPFLYTDLSETSSDSSKRPPSHGTYKVIVARWRSRVAARSSPPSLPTQDSPPTVLQILPAPPGLPRRPPVLVLPARKRVRALPVGRLTSRYPPDHSSSNRFSSDDSSSDYSSDSSLGHSLPDSSFDTPTTNSKGPSLKRCRFPATSVSLATPVPGALSLVSVDLLPPCKRIRGSAIAPDYDDST